MWSQPRDTLAQIQHVRLELWDNLTLKKLCHATSMPDFINDTHIYLQKLLHSLQENFLCQNAFECPTKIKSRSAL